MRIKFISLFILSISFIISCNSVKIKNESYKVSDEITTLLTVGESYNSITQKKYFETFGFPNLNDKIKLDIEILPFTKKLNEVYKSKIKYNQNLPQVNYVDSLEIKPEVLKISIADKASLVNALNNSNNIGLREFIQNTQKASIITSLVVNLDNTTIDKIKQSDAFYLVQVNEAQYGISLYSNNKKIETLNLQSLTMLAYKANDFCWSQNTNGKWFIGDLVEEDTKCNGNTFKKISEKKEKSLYKM